MKGEILRETLPVSAILLIQPLRRGSIEGGQVLVQDNTPVADQVNVPSNFSSRNQLTARALGLRVVLRVTSPRRPHQPKHGRFSETALPDLAKLVNLMQPWDAPHSADWGLTTRSLAVKLAP